MEKRMKKVRLEIDGQWVEGRVAQSKGVLWVHMNGETFTVEPESSGRKRRGAVGGAAHAGEIVAPMPGKIIKVMVEANAVVKKGQALLVMEAMKMEYTLKAPADGAVSEVAAKPGDQVALGQILLQVSPHE
jgi:biotin carboxyl carrier protein